MAGDEELQAAILEETIKEVSKAGNPELVNEILHNLGEIGVEGKMGNVFAIDPERDEDLIPLYSTFDGTVSLVPKVMAPKMLRKRIPRIPEAPREKWGTLAFNLARPADAPVRNRLLCDLHPKNAKREWLDEIGLGGRFCPKDNLSSNYEVQRHRRLYHKDEDSQIVQAETRLREDEVREYQKNIAQILASQVKGGGNAK